MSSEPSVAGCQSLMSTHPPTYRLQHLDVHFFLQIKPILVIQGRASAVVSYVLSKPHFGGPPFFPPLMADHHLPITSPCHKAAVIYRIIERV